METSWWLICDSHADRAFGKSLPVLVDAASNCCHPGVSLNVAYCAWLNWKSEIPDVASPIAVDDSANTCSNWFCAADIPLRACRWDTLSFRSERAVLASPRT